MEFNLSRYKGIFYMLLGIITLFLGLTFTDSFFINVYVIAIISILISGLFNIITYNWLKFLLLHKKFNLIKGIVKCSFSILMMFSVNNYVRIIVGSLLIIGCIIESIYLKDFLNTLKNEFWIIMIGIMSILICFSKIALISCVVYSIIMIIYGVLMLFNIKIRALNKEKKESLYVDTTYSDSTHE